ncbi:MAG: helix-turn-helix domain-containing protein [Acidobacteria bacterium]|nr:helix-turn-helix domain-containing protein [Acidobacteriota bacterium]
MVERLLRVEEASEMTGWKVPTLRAKILRRELTYVKLGRSVRIPLSVIQKLIAENTIPAREGK